jgi:predicted lipoprotein with Yx(FWY)xxD motif
MHSTARLSALSGRRRVRAAAVSAGVLAALCATIVPSGVASAHTAASGSVVAAVKGEFGTTLVAGSGQGAGTALYSITADYGTHIGCTTKVVEVVGSKMSCTGSLSSSTAEWPAYLTTGKPVAGPGVSQKLLGTVNIAGLGTQVTYNGHPLYLFDGIGGVISGENWDESTIPPWHGNWYLLNAKGAFLPRTALFGTVTIKGKSVLAAYMTVGGGFVLFPVYTYSGGSACQTICSDTWPPVISQGTAGTAAGLKAGKFGTVARGDGTTQVTYGGKPLYFDSTEVLALTASGVSATGSGNGAKAPTPYKGTFSLVKA